jgi:LPXTG-motif cell wall-anchored protein
VTTAPVTTAPVTTGVPQTSTTAVESGGPTSNAGATTTAVASGGPTTALGASGGEFLNGLPRTGSDQRALIGVGLLMALGGMLSLLLTRRPNGV